MDEPDWRDRLYKFGKFKTDTAESNMKFPDVNAVQSVLYKHFAEKTLSVNILEQYKIFLDENITSMLCDDCGDTMKLGQLVDYANKPMDKLDIHKQAQFIQDGHCPCVVTEDENTEKTQHGFRLVHMAARYDEFLPILIYLANEGCDLEAVTSPECQTPLLLAIYYNSIETVKYLISRKVKVNVNTSYPQQEAPLSAAITYEREEIVKLLLAVESIDVICKDQNLQPLLVSCVRLHPEFVEMLLEAGSDPNVKTQTCYTALMYSVSSRATDMVKLLIKYGADVNVQNNRGEAALLMVIYREDTEMARILLEAGADPNYFTKHEENSLLVLASYEGCKDIIQLLIKHGARVNQSNHMGYTPLHITAWNGHNECVQLLLEAGAPHDEQTKDKNTPLALAAHGNHLSVIERLLPLGCNVNNADKDQDTPLQYAAYNGMTKACELLIQYGADLNQCNRINATALWNAVYKKRKEVVKLLLLKNVKLEVSSRGINQHSFTDAVEILYDVSRSPLWVSVDRDSPEIAMLLVTAGYNVFREEWLIEENFPVKSKNDRLHAMLSQYVHNPPRLLTLCRNYFRAEFGLDVHDKVKQLQIPVTLKNYLTLTDLSYSTEEEADFDPMLTGSDDDDD